MFKNTHQEPFFTVFYSLGSSPLEIWKPHVQHGYIKRVSDEDVRSLTLEIMGRNVATTYITTPKNPKDTLGIKLPFIILLLKNMKKFFSFEIQILDDQNLVRRFRVANYASSTKVHTFSTSMPLALAPGWNQIQFNLADFTRRAYGTNYLETVRIQIHANIRLRRIYFANRLYTQDELANEYKLTLATAIKKPQDGSNEPIARPPTPEKNCKESCEVEQNLNSNDNEEAEK